MDSKNPVVEKKLISPQLKNRLESLSFILTQTPDNGVMWGFDGSTKYFPRETYIRESKNGKPRIKLRIEKTNNGIRLIINSEPFHETNHLNRSQLMEEEIISILEEYLNLI